MGAVNTVVVRDGRVTGYNTDWVGVAESLREAGLVPTSDLQEADLDTVAVIGVGGVARAVCYALDQAGTREIRLYDPIPGKANAMRAMFSHGQVEKSGRRSEIVVVETVEDALKGVHGICQCSPVGMVGHPGVPFSPELFSSSISSDASAEVGTTTKRKQWLLECIYTPVRTELVREAQQAGLMTITGDRLNLHQFLRQFELVTGLQPKFHAAEAYFRSLLEVAAESNAASAAPVSKI